MSIGSSLLALFPARSRARGRRRPAALSLRFEACESRCVLSATGLVDIVAAESHEDVATFADVSMQQEVHEGDHEGGHGGDVIGSVVDGRLVTNHRAYGYEVEPDTTVFDVGFDVTGLVVGSELQLHVLQGVTFWNGAGNPKFTPVRGGVEMNFNYEAENVRIGATRNVGREIPIGEAVATEGGTEVHDHFDVTVGRNWNGSAFGAPGPNGIYVIVGRLVGDGVNASAPMAFVLNVGASETAHEAAIEFFEDGPPVSVFGVETPSGGNKGLGQVLQVTYRFSDAVTVRGAPRLPLTIGGKARFAVYDSGASSGESVVFSYRLRPGDNGAVRLARNELSIQLPNGSAIRGGAGGTVFSTFSVTWPEMQALTTLPRVTRVGLSSASGQYGPGDVIDFRVTWDRNVFVTPAFNIAPTIQVRAIGGDVLGDAEWSSLNSTGSSYLFRYFVEAGSAAPRGIRVVGPISLNGGMIRDLFNNESVLAIRPLTLPNVRVVTS